MILLVSRLRYRLRRGSEWCLCFVGRLVVVQVDLSGWWFGGFITSMIRNAWVGLVLCLSVGEGESVVGAGVAWLVW